MRKIKVNKRKKEREKENKKRSAERSPINFMDKE
jgi:hypothetical protein